MKSTGESKLSLPYSLSPSLYTFIYQCKKYRAQKHDDGIRESSIIDQPMTNENSNAITTNDALSVDVSESLQNSTTTDTQSSDAIAVATKETLVSAPELLTKFSVEETSSLPSTIDTSIEAQNTRSDHLGDLPPATTTLPVVEPQESDLREEVIPATMEQADEARSEKHILDSIADSDLASGLDATNTAQQPTETANDTMPDAASTSEAPQQQDITVANALDVLTPSLSEAEITLTSPSADVKHEDTIMVDAPASPAKVAREREEDSEDGPLAKRTKVFDDGNDEPKFAVPDAPNPATTELHNGISTPAADVSAPATPAASTPAPNDEPTDDSKKPTEYQVKEILKLIRKEKNTKNGRNFKEPVSKMWPTLAEAYAAKVPSPVDLSAMDQKLKDGGYETLADFKVDVNKIYSNSVLYNGEEHVVTSAAAIVRDAILSKIPGPEPPKPAPKVAKRSTPKPEVPRGTQARRASRGGATAPPNGAIPSETFALGPSGTPLIRRDSTKIADGGRPKREIHPPKNKDLVYSSRPKKKKFAAELKFCEIVLGELKKPKNLHIAYPFLAPVDPVALGIPTYFNVIKNPMDLGTVGDKLQIGEYEKAKEFEEDVRLTFKNCFKFNPPVNEVYKQGKALEEEFNKEWSKKAQYIADHGEPVNVASPVEDDSEDEEESEEEEIDDPPESSSDADLASLNARLIEEQNKLIDLMGNKKPNQLDITLQQQIVNVVKGQIDAEQAKAAKSKKKSKPAKPSKKAAPKPKKSANTAKPYKVKSIGVAEKEVISNGIGSLNEHEMGQAIKLLKIDFPALNVEDEVEFDIDQFTPSTLSKLYDLITRTHPELLPAKAAKTERTSSKPSKPKKNKPMSKTEQEAKIEQLKKTQAALTRGGSQSDDANTSVRPCK